MNLKMLKKKTEQLLLEKIEHNLDLYRNENFLYLDSDEESRVIPGFEIDEDLLKQIDCKEIDNSSVEDEITNCIHMSQSMLCLSPYLARDERVWTYYTHTTLLNYTRKRWPIPDNDEKAVTHIKNHWFARGKRTIERDNAASRLWWMHYIAEFADNLDPDVALRCLCHRGDVRSSLLERPTTSQSRAIVSGILNLLHESYNGDQELFERKRFRGLMKALNFRGGSTLIEALDDLNTSALIKECIAPEE